MKIFRNTVGSVEIISYYTGYVVLCMAVLMLIPIATSLIFAEWNPLLDFLISMAITVLVGLGME